MYFDLIKENRLLSPLRGEEGYLLIIVTLIGLVLAIIFGYTLPQLHMGEQIRAMNCLNEQRAYEAARKGINAVRLGLKEIDNFQELIGYPITSVKKNTKEFTIDGEYAYRFPSGSQLRVYNSNRNDGLYSVKNAFSEEGGPTRIRVYEKIPNAKGDGVICNTRGILWAMDRLLGATQSSTKRDEYRDPEGNIEFVSGCLNVNLDGNEDGSLKVMIIISRDGNVNDTPDGNINNEGWYFYNNGERGPNGLPWLSPDNWKGKNLEAFQYKDGSLRYYDFDLKDNMNSNNYKTHADLKYRRTDGEWYFTIGNNGSWRGQYRDDQLWNLRKRFSVAERPFKNEDEELEIFIIVRSTGITAGPGPNYGKDKTDLQLVNDATNGALPNPMRQVLEAGLYLTDANGDNNMEVRRFYFSQAHNLED